MAGSLNSLRDHSILGSEAEPSHEKPACQHKSVRGEKSVEGNFQILRTFCADCGDLLDEERVLGDAELNRCPVDPRLDRCFTVCPVEEGSPEVFEHPCLPVTKALEDAGIKPRAIPLDHPAP